MVVPTNVILTKGSTSVTIHTISISRDWNKKLITIDIPRSAAKWGEGVKTILKDLLRVRRTITIDGWITGSGALSDTDILDNLRSIVEGGGTFNLKIAHYKDCPPNGYVVNISHLNSREFPIDQGTATLPADVVKIRIKASFIIGTSNIS